MAQGTRTGARCLSGQRGVLSGRALRSQRSSSTATRSIGANLAEGCGRGSDNDFARFVRIAMGSASEAEYLLLLARDLRELSEEDWNRLNDRVTGVKRMLTALIKTLRADS